MYSGRDHDPTSQFSLPNFFLDVNLVAKGAQMLFKTLAPPAYSIGYLTLLLML